ncbi:MAG: bifunctional oligoribonuclease/PAP phosphatase NrnA [Actinomycetota bacterium]
MIDERETARAAQIISTSRELMIFGHHFPDGDAIGSILGLGLMLEKAGHRVQASWPEPFEPPEKYDFLPGRRMLRRPSELVPAGAAIALDCANAGRLEELEQVATSAPGLINMDHHPDNSMFGDANLVDHQCAATAQIIYEHATGLDIRLDLESALCLYTAIVTDTGRFQYSNTHAGTFEAAAEMVRMGVEPNLVFANVFQNDSLAYLRLTGSILSGAVYDDDLGLVYAALRREDMKRFGVAMNETEDLVDSLRTLRAHRVAALFKELQDGKVRVSLRSRADTDIGSLARRMGGGGHRVAAGYTSSARGVDAAVEELREELGGRSAGAG